MRGLARTLTVLLALAALAACREDPIGLDRSGVRPPGWSDATHGPAAPDYAAVFPRDSVNRIDVRMTAAQWARVRADMVSRWGFDFGGEGNPRDVDPVSLPVRVRFAGREWANVGWGLKGQASLYTAWTQGSYKLPFRLDFGRFDPEQRFHGFEKLAMANAINDPSLIRETVAADVLRMAGIPAARASLYRVYIDFGQGPRYVGLYTMVEVVEDTMTRDQLGGGGGNVYKPHTHFREFARSDFEKKSNEELADWSDVRAVVDALHGPLRTSDPERWRRELEAVFDVDRFLRWLAVNNTIVNWDAHGVAPANFYLYTLPTGRVTWIPWDHSEAMKLAPGITADPTEERPWFWPLSLTMNEVGDDWPLIRYLADDPVYFERYRAFMKSFRDTVFTEERIFALLDRYHRMAAPHAVGPGGEEPGATSLRSPQEFVDALEALKAHVRERRALVARFAP